MATPARRNSTPPSITPTQPPARPAPTPRTSHSERAGALACSRSAFATAEPHSDAIHRLPRRL
eukprot:4361248-Alexandrium_andersonii.AAC.1